MKRSKRLTATVFSAVTMLAVHTAPVAAEVSTEAKHAGVVAGSFITGAAAGGPFGALAGMLVGVWMGEQVRQADEVSVMEEQLGAAAAQAEALALRLAKAESLSQAFAQIALDQLQLELLFKTNEAQLTESGRNRVAYLADFLVKNANLNIRLDGFSDPRGEDSYNRDLSLQRAQSVARILTEHGVAGNRIETYAHGASHSSAPVGDYDSYALERMVRIQLTKGSNSDAFAQISLAQ